MLYHHRGDHRPRAIPPRMACGFDGSARAVAAEHARGVRGSHALFCLPFPRVLRPVSHAAALPESQNRKLPCCNLLQPASSQRDEESPCPTASPPQIASQGLMGTSAFLRGKWRRIPAPAWRQPAPARPCAGDPRARSPAGCRSSPALPFALFPKGFSFFSQGVDFSQILHPCAKKGSWCHTPTM